MVVCSSVITIPQKSTSSTCWFNSILMALLYSQGMRTILLKKTFSGTHVKNIIHEILHNYYVNNNVKNNKYLNFYNTFTPESILNKLNEENPEKFNVIIKDNNSHKGYSAWKYINKMIEYLDIKKYVYLDAILKDAETDEYGLYFKPYVFDEMNKEFTNEEEEEAAIKVYFNEIPEVLIINTKSSINSDDYYPDYSLKQNDVYFEEEIIYNGDTYVVDSMIIDNFNSRVSNKAHTICGISCGGQRYIYNGWTSLKFNEDLTSLTKKPCELMKHNWLDKTKEQFCINLNQCNLEHPETKEGKKNALIKELCFSYKKGPRIYIYIRKDLLNNVKNETIGNTGNSGNSGNSGNNVKKENNASQASQGGKSISNKYKYKGRLYKIHIGPKGGKYIISQGIKIRIPK
jgi:hypothetical protein